MVSYTIWFTQRTGSTLLCKALEATGVAGKPGEWLYVPDAGDFLQHFGARNYAELQKRLWLEGSTSNGVCGLKFGFFQPYFDRILTLFHHFPGCPQTGASRADVWNHAFPNGRHIFMTRRNKVRLAVSWWKAIKTREWHREKNQQAPDVDLTGAYSFEAIHRLLTECTLREAGIQEFFSEADIVPFSIAYEDFLEDYEGTITNVLRYLGLDTSGIAIGATDSVRLADEISEDWVQRFRLELQRNWQNIGW